MNGTRQVPLVLQPRDRQLLHAVGVLRVLDREQAKIVGGFHSTTRANTRLLTLTRAGFLARIPVGTVRGGHKFLYSLTRRGARLVDLPYRGTLRTHTVLAGNLFLEHQLRLNDLFLQLVHQPISRADVRVQTWKTFQRSLSRAVGLIPDGYLELTHAGGTVCAFVEIDMGTESLHQWRQKVQAYLQFATAGEFTRLFRHPQFRVLVVLPSERRMATVRHTVSTLTSKIFWFTTFEFIQGHGLWSASWVRPTGTDRKPLV
jgi:hypothetical protein